MYFWRYENRGYFSTQSRSWARYSVLGTWLSWYEQLLTARRTLGLELWYRVMCTLTSLLSPSVAKSPLRFYLTFSKSFFFELHTLRIQFIRVRLHTRAYFICGVVSFGASSFSKAPRMARGLGAKCSRGSRKKHFDQCKASCGQKCNQMVCEVELVFWSGIDSACW